MCLLSEKKTLTIGLHFYLGPQLKNKYGEIIARVSMSNVPRFVWTYPGGCRRFMVKSCTRQLCLTSISLLFKYFAAVEAFR